MRYRACNFRGWPDRVYLTPVMPISLNNCKSDATSQNGEDGVIAAVFQAIGVKSRTCVEFGAYDLKQYSNVYSLWTNGWRALLIEGNKLRYEKIKKDYAAHPQAAEQRVSIDNRFVSPEGPDSLDNILAAHGFPEDLDLVCIDVDSIDLQIWRGLTRFRPRLVVVEYNCMIPPHIELIASAGGNNIGCSALSLLKLGKQKGYALVACIGWNAFFVKQEDAHHFANVDDLEKLFDRTWLRYAMQTYSGEVFFDAPLLLPHRLFCRDSHLVESCSVPLGRASYTLAGGAKQAVMHCLHCYTAIGGAKKVVMLCLRKVKRRIWRMLGR